MADSQVESLSNSTHGSLSKQIIKKEISVLVDKILLDNVGQLQQIIQKITQYQLHDIQQSLYDISRFQLIYFLLSTDQDLSFASSEALTKLIQNSSPFKESLIKSGFIDQSRFILINDTSPNHVKQYILDVIQNLIRFGADIEDMNILIPILDKISDEKSTQNQEISTKAKIIRDLLSAQGVSAEQQQQPSIIIKLQETITLLNEELIKERNLNQETKGKLLQNLSENEILKQQLQQECSINERLKEELQQMREENLKQFKLIQEQKDQEIEKKDKEENKSNSSQQEDHEDEAQDMQESNDDEFEVLEFQFQQDQELIQQQKQQLQQQQQQKQQLQQQKQQQQIENIIKSKSEKTIRAVEHELELASSGSNSSLLLIEEQIPFEIRISPGSYIKEKDQFTYTSTIYEGKTFPISPAVTQGIVKCELKINQQKDIAVGIMKSGLVVPFGKYIGNQPYCKDCVIFSQSGSVFHNGKTKAGNRVINDNDTVSIEVNMKCSPRTATLFINDYQQIIFASGIPESVQFWFKLNYQNDSVTVVSLKRLNRPTSVKIPREKYVKWE